MNFAENEKKILEYWEREQIFKKLQAKNRGKKPWSFFDGPITANNAMGVHHAWGRTLKDFYQRYHAMRGFDERFQNGFDCQGLWVEVEVERDLGFNSKRDIEAYGLDKFSRACIERVKKYAAIQTEQSKRLGQWMDFEHSYFTMSEENNLHIWQFLKRCDEKGWIRKGTDVVPWCWRCGTAISQHELSDGGYADVTHNTVYLAFPIIAKGEKGKILPLRAGGDTEGVEALLVWTTTPWTLLANVAAAVKPDMDYVKVQEGLWLAKDRVRAVFGDDVKILETKKGKDLVGWTYQGPFDDLPASNVPHRVVAWDDVSSEEGTGIVHIAPGCGKEDHDLGLRETLPIIDPIEEDGAYRAGFGDLTGKKAQEVSEQVITALEKKHILVKQETLTHSYPICWRCKEQLLFRVSTEWFIRADEIRPLMKKAARAVVWHPAYAEKRMQDWLDNMGDWPISRKRYWGLALPIYECSCGEITVIGSKKELRERASDPKTVDALPELHRPWIDVVHIRCPKCESDVARISDVGDCWLDAGIVPFSTLKYPTPDNPGDPEYWKKWFPASLVCESISQVKLWFYTQLFMSVTLEDRAPYQNICTYASVVDAQGKPMHKSTGNTVWFDDAIETMGADIMRWMYLRGAVEENLRFGFAAGDEIRKKLLVAWNVVSFFTLFQEKREGKKKVTALDRWISARLQETIVAVTDSVEQYHTPEAVRALELCMEDLSTWYVRRSRDRVKEGDPTPRIVLRETLTTLAQLLAPFIPFFAESMYQEIKKFSPCEAGGDTEGVWGVSVHLQDWPRGDKRKINRKLLDDMASVRKLCELAHAVRASAGVRVRQPLGIAVYSGAELSPELEQLFADEVNVMKVVRDDVRTVQKPVSVSDGPLTVTLELTITPELEQAGMVRELTRSINQFRKELGLRAGENVALEIIGEGDAFNRVLQAEGDHIFTATHGVRTALGSDAHIKYIQIDGQTVTIRIQTP